MGLLAEGYYDNEPILDIIIPKITATIKSELNLDEINIGDEIFIEICGVKLLLYDNKISIIGKVIKPKTNNININNNIIDNEEEDEEEIPVVEDILLQTTDYIDDDEENEEDDEEEDDEEDDEEEDDIENIEDEFEEEDFDIEELITDD